MAATVESSEKGFANELITLQALANEFEDYIIDGQVYRTVLVTGDQGNYRVEMSGGDMLARVETLQRLGTHTTSARQAQLNDILAQIEKSKREFHTRFHELLRRELAARLNTALWADDERGDDNEENERTPAEDHNQRCIALIRQELG
ncbi:MAG: hypothetical protein KDE31_25085 [Caldilineaceae bacterium]|nr:hypothetical protein [Caldilineaceae bacterium]